MIHIQWSVNMRIKLLFALILTTISLPQSAHGISFQAEKDRLLKKFKCANEQILLGNASTSSIWRCFDSSGNYVLQMSRKQNSQDLLNTLQLIIFTPKNEAIKPEMLSVSKNIADKYANQYSSDIVNILKNCNQPESFSANISVDVGCIKGPVVTERHLIVRMQP